MFLWKQKKRIKGGMDINVPTAERIPSTVGLTYALPVFEKFLNTA